MEEELNGRNCEQENDLIAFLYDEMDAGERTFFRSHLQACSSCSAELSEFTNIRESVVGWRNEALVGATSPAVQVSHFVRADMAKPTALTALREFFNLSPLWMKGAVVFASFLFCLFAVLAAARLWDTPSQPLAVTTSDKTYSEQELNAVVERRVEEERQRIKKSLEQTQVSPVIATDASDRVSHRKGSNRFSLVASTVPQQRARRPLSKVERQQLAADLRLTADPTESELDLLDDRVNQ